MAIRLIVTLLGLLLLIAALASVKILQFKAMGEAGASMMPPPEVVASGKVERVSWEQLRHSVGTLEAVRGVTVTADLPGRVDGIVFNSGAEVKKGDLLIQQNTDAEQAQLRAAEASLALAKADLARTKELLAKKVVSQSQFDAADAQFKAAAAQVENSRVAIDKKTVRAPFDGRLGIRQVNLGQDLQQGAPIVTLQTTNPMLVNFSLPQRDLPVLAMGLKVRVTTDAVPGETFIGSVTALNPEVNSRSRNVLVQATLDNPNNKLLPGTFASIEIVLPESRSILVVPITAISYATYGDSIFVLEPKNENGTESWVAKQQFVQLGEARGDMVELLKGAQEGADIAVSGLFKIQNGASVSVNNSVKPVFETTPNPVDR
jgi:membrane fusion protein, multidrug efflux system